MLHCNEPCFAQYAATASNIVFHNHTVGNGKQNISYSQKFMVMDSSSAGMNQHTLIDLCSITQLHTLLYLYGLHQTLQINFTRQDTKDNKRQLCAPKM